MRLALLVSFALVGCNEYKLNIDTDPNDIPNDFPPGTPVPDIAVTPGTVPFGAWVTDCPTEPRDVTISNVGDAGSQLVISEITLATGTPDFGMTATPTTLNAGDSMTFQVWFQPQAFASFTGDVKIVSNDPDEHTVDVSLDGSGSDEARVEELFEQNPSAKVDVLWVVDNSCSMADQQTELGLSIHAFIESFVAMGVNFHIGLTSTSMDPGEDTGAPEVPLAGELAGSPTVLDSTMPNATVISDFQSRASLGTAGSFTEKGFDASYAALTDPLIHGANTGFLRDDANLAVVVLSDEDEQSSMSSSSYASWLDGLKGDPERSSMSAIVGALPRGLVGSCDSNQPLGPSAVLGQKYIDAVEATGGIVRDICDMDNFASFVTFLSYSAAGLSDTFDLSQRPSGIGSIVVTVGGTPVGYDAQNGWTYDPSTNSVVFNGSSMPGPNQVVEISYLVANACN